MPFIFPLANQRRPLGRARVVFTLVDEAPESFVSWPSDQFETRRAVRAFCRLHPQSSSQGSFWWEPLPCSELVRGEQSHQWFGASADFATLLAMLHAERPISMAREQVWATGELPAKGHSLELIEVSHLHHKVLHFLDISEQSGALSQAVFFLPRSQLNELRQDPALRDDTRAEWREWPPDQEELSTALFPTGALHESKKAIVVGVESGQLESFVQWLEEGSDTYEAFLQNKTVPPPPPKPFWARTWLKWMAIGALLVLLLASGLSLDVGMCGGVMQPAFSIAKGGKHGAQSMAVYRCGLLCTNRCDLLGALATKGQDALCRTACYTSELKLRCLRVQKEQARLSAKEWLLQHRKVCHLLAFQSLYSPNRQMNPLIQWHNTHCALFASKYTQQEQAKESLVTFCRNKP